MARCSIITALACCAMGLLTQGAGAQLTETQSIEDSEALVQTRAHVEQNPGGPTVKILEAFSKMGAKIMERQEQVLANLQNKVVSKLQARLNSTFSQAKEASLGPSAEEEARIKKAKEDWEARLELERKAQKAEEEAKALEAAMEAKKAKYGELMKFNVRDPMGREITVNFRSSTPLRVLKSSVSKRLNLPVSETNFTYADLPLPSNETPESIGMIDNDVIEVSSEGLEREKREKEAADKAAAEQAEMRAQEQQRELQVALKKAQSRMIKAKEAEKVHRRQQKEQDMRKSDKLVLKFVNEEGKEITLAFKKGNHMGPLSALVSKRFGMDEKRTSLHYGPDGKKIRPDDTARSLGLKDTEVITVKQG